MDEVTKARMDGMFNQAKALKEAERQKKKNEQAVKEAFDEAFWAKVSEVVLPSLHELVDYLKSKGMEAEVVDDRGRKVWDSLENSIGIKFHDPKHSRAKTDRVDFCFEPHNGAVMWETSVPNRKQALRHTDSVTLQRFNVDFVNTKVTELLGIYLQG